MKFNLKDDYFSSCSGGGIYLAEVDENGNFVEPVDIVDRYFIPYLDLWANLKLRNLKLRDKYQDIENIQALPYSARFSASVLELIKSEGERRPIWCKEGNVFYFLAGFILNSDDRVYTPLWVHPKGHGYTPDGVGLVGVGKVRFILYGKGEQLLPVTTYRFEHVSKGVINPFDVISKSKQFVDFIDMEKRFYGKTAFIVLDHYRLGGKAISKAINLDFDR